MHCESRADANAADGRVAVVTGALIQPHPAVEPDGVVKVDVLHRIPLTGETERDHVDALALGAVAMLGLDGWEHDLDFERVG